MIFAIFLVLLPGFALATAPTLSSASDSPDPITIGSVIIFTAATAPGADLLPFTLHICKDGNTTSCTKWCSDTDLNSNATTSECSYTTSAGDVGVKDYNAFVCDSNSVCSNVLGWQFTVNSAAADTAPPSVSVKDINGDSLAPYWARTDQNVTLTLNAGETNAECKWSDTNWGTTSYAGEGTVCITSGSEAVCKIGAKTQTTGTSNTVYYNCKDSSANATGGIAASYGVDYTNPTGTISSSISANSANLTFTGTDAQSGVQKYEVSLDGASYIDRGTSTTHTFSGLSNGDHNFTLRISDVAGNFAIFSETKNINFDPSSIGTPAISSGTHSTDANWFSGNNVDFSWTSVAGATKYRYALTDSSNTTPDGNSETATTGRSYAGVAEGEHWLHVAACVDSNCGNAAHFKIKIDTVQPEPVPGISGFGQSNGTVYISWGAPSDTSGIREYIVYRHIFEKVGSRTFVPSDPGVKKFSGIKSTNFTDNNGLEINQVYYYRIQALDNASNLGAMSAVQKIQNSNTSCNLTFSSNLAQYTKGGTFNLVLTVSGGQIRNAALRLKTPGTAFKNLLENQSGSTISKTIEIPTNTGEGVVEIEGKTEFGMACKKQFGFTIDSQNPQVSIVSPTDGSAVQGTIGIEASATDNSGIEKLEAQLDAKLIGEMAKNGDKYTLAWNAQEYSAGSHKLKVIATDLAGNQNSKEMTIRIEPSSASIYLEKVYSYDTAMISQTLKKAQIKQELRNSAAKLIFENAPQRKLTITRSAPGLSAIITVTLRNSGTTKKLQAIEAIPKGVSENARDIKSGQEFSVIQGDPIIRFDLGEVANGSEAIFSYTVGSGLTDEQANKIADAFDSFASPPILLEGEQANPIESMLSEDIIFYVFIGAVALIVILIIVVVLGGGAFMLHRHIKTRDVESYTTPKKRGRGKNGQGPISSGKWSVK